MSSAIDAVTEAVHTHIGGFHPENVEDLRDFLDSLPGVFEGINEALTNMAGNFSDTLPLRQTVNEMLTELGSSIAGLADQAREIRPAYEREHEEELRRIDEPAPGEEFHDVSTNQ